MSDTSSLSDVPFDFSDHSPLSDVPSDLSDTSSPSSVLSDPSDTSSLSSVPSNLSEMAPSPPPSPYPRNVLYQYPESYERTRLPLTTESVGAPSSRPSTAKAEQHIPQPGPAKRQSRLKRWPHGVLAGGMLIDLLECLSGRQESSDCQIALWLEKEYIIPFGRVERLDGLIVEDPAQTDMLTLAYSCYIKIEGNAAKCQRLWVPGLEPRYQRLVDRDSLPLPSLPPRFKRKAWRASGMQFKDGVERKRLGIFEGKWRDEMGWEREIWKEAPPPPTVSKRLSERLNTAKKA